MFKIQGVTQICGSMEGKESLKILLSVGLNISSKNGFMICFFNGYSNISPMNFHSQFWIEHTLGEKRTIMQNNFLLHKINVFPFNCQALHSSKINSFLDLKQKPIR